MIGLGGCKGVGVGVVDAKIGVRVRDGKGGGGTKFNHKLSFHSSVFIFHYLQLKIVPVTIG